MKNNKQEIDAIGDNHIGTSAETPLRKDAFDKTRQKTTYSTQ
jgi:hypothetical protein